MNKNISILMLNYEFPPIGGGAGRANLNLLREFAKQPNITVDVLTASQHRQFQSEQFSSNIHLYRIGLHKRNLHYWKKTEVIEWLFKASRYYNNLVQSKRYDLVHSFFAFPSGSLALKTAGRIPYILSLRGSDVPGYNVRLKLDYILLKGLFARIWQNADAIIANSKGLAELAAKFQPNLEIGVICNGIDTEFFRPPAQRQITYPVQLLTVCRLISRKRLHLLIEALKLIRENGIDAELNIAGEGILQNELSSFADKLGLRGKVRFAGLIEYPQMPAMYQHSHIYVMSSEHEGMSNSMLEAMACGLPIVTTPCEGVDELIDESNGTIVYDSSPNGIANALSKIIHTPDQYEQMQVAARNKASDFGWASTAEQYIHVYERILQMQKQSCDT